MSRYALALKPSGTKSSLGVLRNDSTTAGVLRMPSRRYRWISLSFSLAISVFGIVYRLIVAEGALKAWMPPGRSHEDFGKKRMQSPLGFP